MQVLEKERRKAGFGLVPVVQMPFDDMYLCFDNPKYAPPTDKYAGRLYFEIGAYKFIHHAP